MIEQTARVLEVDGESVLLATEQQAGCQSCDVKGGCGTSVIGRLFPQRPQQHLRLSQANIKPPARPGDQVVIGIDEGHLQKSTLFLYAVPLLGLLVGALLGGFLGERFEIGASGEPMSILLGLLGLSIGLIALKYSALGSGLGSGDRLSQAVKILRVNQPAFSIGLADLQKPQTHEKPR